MKRFSSKQGASVLIVCSMMASSCGQIISTTKYQTESNVNQIIGQDDRTPEMEEMKVGSLHKNGEHICTAFAIGPQEIGTASHCVADGVDSLTWKTKEGEFKVLEISKIYKDADYAILKIDGKNPTWFTAGNYDKNGYLKIISAVVGDSLLSNVVTGGELRKGFLLHGLDTIGGSSGSPILQNGKVVAVHLGSYKKANVGVLLSEVEKIHFDPLLYKKENWGVILTAVSAAVSIVGAYYAYRSFDLSNKKDLRDRIVEANTVKYATTDSFERVTVFMRDGTSKVVVDLDRKTVKTEGPVTQSGCFEAIDEAIKKSGSYVSDIDREELRGQCPAACNSDEGESMIAFDAVLLDSPENIIKLMSGMSGTYV